MPGTTGQNGIPYMTDGDPLSTVAAKMQELADKTNKMLGLAGKVQVSMSNTRFGTAVVNFPAGYFAAAPVVVASTESGDYYAVVTPISATSCTVYAVHRAGTLATVTVWVDWQARPAT